MRTFHSLTYLGLLLYNINFSTALSATALTYDEKWQPYPANISCFYEYFKSMMKCAIKYNGTLIRIALKKNEPVAEETIKVTVREAAGDREELISHLVGGGYHGYVIGRDDSDVQWNRVSENRFFGNIDLRDVELEVEPAKSNHVVYIKYKERKEKSRKRIRRDTGSGFDGIIFKCNIKLIADYSLYKHVGEEDVKLSMDYLFALIDDEAFYSSKLWFTFLEYSDFTIYPKHMEIETTPTVDIPEVDPTVILQRLSRINTSSEYCAVVKLTYQNFAHGITSLSFQGSAELDGPPGGICQGIKNERGDFQFLNTMVMTMKYHNKQLPIKATRRMFLHGLGHLMGAPHDTDRWCGQQAPAEETKIMYPSIFVRYSSFQSGKGFSECSRQAIAQYLLLKGTCFSREKKEICGNGIIDQDARIEECDCGSPSSCQQLDPCCYPAGSGNFSCKYKPDARCNPNDDECCTPDCTLVPREENKVCGLNSSSTSDPNCHFQRFCANLPKCPEMSPINGKSCNRGMGTCFDNHCSDDLCADLGHEKCTCKNPSQCLLCCKIRGKCQPIYSLGPISNQKRPLFRPVGSLCDADRNEEGECAFDGKCQPLDPFPFLTQFVILIPLSILALSVRLFAYCLEKTNPRPRNALA